MSTAPSTRISAPSHCRWSGSNQCSRCQVSEYEEQDLNDESLEGFVGLKYFHVSLFSTILEDTITKLRILEECNTELTLKKVSTDMVHLLAHKYHVEEPAVKDELGDIDPKRLGCMEYILNKLRADRTFAIQVLVDTYLNLTIKRQFYHLSDAVEDAEERCERFDFLMEEEAKNKLLYRDICRQLRQQRNHIKLATYDRNNTIKILKCSVEDVELFSATRHRYVTGWERARSEQHRQVIIDKEAKPTVKIEFYKTRIGQEQHVHSEVELLLNIKIQELLEKIEHWMKKYDTDIEEMNLKIQRKRYEYEGTYERRIMLEEKIKKHAQLLKNWVTFNEEREAARLYREKMFNCAVTIQAWWRGLLVRKQIGPYKVVKKRAAKSEEKSEKKKEIIS